MNEKTGDQGEGSSKEQRRLSTTRYLKLNRLPTLQEVLDRRTRPPLDLFCFYVGVPLWVGNETYASARVDLLTTRICRGCSGFLARCSAA